MKRAIVAALAAALLIAVPVSGVTILREQSKAPDLVGDPVWGAAIAYDFNDHRGRLVVNHRCQEVYEFLPDGGILHGPILQRAFLGSGETVTLDAWPSTSWGLCVAYIVNADDHSGAGGPSDLWYLVPPAP